MAETYLGLSAADFADIHEAIAEAMGYVAVPVTFYVARPVTNDIDALYAEAPHLDNWVVYGGHSVRASIKLTPTAEELTRFGLLAGAALLGFIPRQHILDWQTASGLTWAPSSAMEVEFQGVRYNVSQAIRTDWLPVGDGSTLDTIGPVFTATTKPTKLGA